MCRHDRDADRLGADGGGDFTGVVAGGLGAHRHRFIRISSRSVTGRPSGVRWSPRFGAVCFSGRRESRIIIGAFVCGDHHHPTGSVGAGLVLIGGIGRHRVLAFVGKWYGRHLHMVRSLPRPAVAPVATIPTRKAVVALAILGLLIFSKYFYLVSLTNYYIFFLIDRFQLSEQAGQIYLFAFLFAVAAGTIVGGPIGDRIGRRRVIIISILGVAPFTLLLPYVNLFWTCALSLVVGVVLASAFSAILVYAQELLPGRVGLVSGLFFGFAFGMAGIGAAVLGHLADYTSIGLVYKVCAFLPLLGLFALFLPDLGRSHRATERQSPELSKL